MKKLKFRNITFCFLAMIYALLVLCSYMENRYMESNINVTIVPQLETGHVIFRGAMVDKSWYDPQNLIIEPHDWAMQENNTLEATSENPLRLRIPVGVERILIFNIGPEEGTVIVSVGENEIEKNLYNSELMDGGLNLPYVRFSNKTKLYFVALFVLAMLTAVMSSVNISIRKRTAVSEKRASAGNKNSSIELLRFLFIICIAIHHATGQPLGAYLGVDFFFLLSGFFLMQYYSNDVQAKESPAIAAIQYTKKRYFRVIPYYLFSFFLAVGLTVGLWKAVSPDVMITDYIWELFMMGTAGISMNMAVPAGWFCSALIISGFLIYFLLARYQKTYLYIIEPVSLVLVFAWMYRNIGHLNRWTQVDMFVESGVLRGFVEMGLGCISYEVYCTLRQRKLGGYAINTAVETVCALYIVHTIKMGPSARDFMCVFAMAVLITSLFMENSFWSKLFNHRFSKYLGSISIAIYLNHSVLLFIDWAALGGLLGLDWHSSVAIYVLVSIGFSAVSSRFVENVRGIMCQRNEEKTKS